MSNLLKYLQVDTVRHPIPFEPLPEWALEGKQFPMLDCQWVWLATSGMDIHAVLVASPCHGLVQLHRLVVAPGAPLASVRTVINTAAKELKGRGFKHFMVFANPLRTEENKLLAIARMLGAVESSDPHVLSLGPIPEVA